MTIVLAQTLHHLIERFKIYAAVTTGAGALFFVAYMAVGIIRTLSVPVLEITFYTAVLLGTAFLESHFKVIWKLAFVLGAMVITYGTCRFFLIEPEHFLVTGYMLLVIGVYFPLKERFLTDRPEVQAIPRVSIYALLLRGRRFWLLPTFAVVSIVGFLIVIAKGSDIAPFIYTVR